MLEMLWLVFFESQRGFLINYLPKDQTINEKYYANLLDEVDEKKH